MRVDILGKPYRLIEIEPSSAPDFSGTTNRESQTITVVMRSGKEQRADALLHEAVHVVDQELCLGLTEAQVCALACGLYTAGCRVSVYKDARK
jgi:hypothetical protein